MFGPFTIFENRMKYNFIKSFRTKNWKDKQSNKFLYRIQKLSYIEHNVQVSSILIIISLWQQIYETRKTIVHRSMFHPAKHFPSYT